MDKFDHGDLKYLVLELPEEIKFYKYSGDFDGELAAIERYMGYSLTDGMEKRLTLEKYIAEEMKNDYLITEAELISEIREEYPHFDGAALRECMKRGHVDFILHDDQPHFQRAARLNILNNCGNFLKELEGIPTEPYYNPQRHENADIMRKKGERAFRFRIRMSIKPTENYERIGEMLRIHLPFPQECEEQSEVRLLSSSDEVFISDATQRTAYIETPCVPGKDYFVEFSYVNRAVYRELKAEKVEAPDYFEYLGEKLPHIRFTPYLRELADKIADGETNRLELARRVYNWITENVGYSYMRHYFCLENIAENTALNRRGDCGVQALLFITLCRILGVPARWQSGCAVRHGSIGDHDWAQFYVDGYGWLYADPSFGGGAFRNGDTELRDYYFGNLDCFRLVTCREFQSEFNPSKQYMRRDPYDNQDGEAEYFDQALFFGQVECDKTLISAEEID